MKPFNQGHEAFRRGLFKNPYHNYNNFEAHRSWELGFNKAYFANLKRVKQNEKQKEKS